MTDVVFATLDAGGNVPPLKDTAVEVVRRGHRVRVLGHEQQRASFERVGLEFHAYTGSEWDPTIDRSTPQSIRAFVDEFTGAQKGADLAALLEHGSIAVVDCMQLAGLKAAQDLKERAGEVKATPSQVWVQAPGTPAVGMVFLRDYTVCREPQFLAAALLVVLS